MLLLASIAVTAERAVGFSFTTNSRAILHLASLEDPGFIPLIYTLITHSTGTTTYLGIDSFCGTLLLYV